MASAVLRVVRLGPVAGSLHTRAQSAGSQDYACGSGGRGRRGPSDMECSLGAIAQGATQTLLTWGPFSGRRKRSRKGKREPLTASAEAEEFCCTSFGLRFGACARIGLCVDFIQESPPEAPTEARRLAEEALSAARTRGDLEAFSSFGRLVMVFGGKRLRSSRKETGPLSRDKYTMPRPPVETGTTLSFAKRLAAFFSRLPSPGRFRGAWKGHAARLWTAT